MKRFYNKCHNCGGSGKVPVESGEGEVNMDVCHVCDGSGIVPPTITDLIKNEDAEEEVYKCPICKEYELRNERIGNKDVPFENWARTANWICDNPDCKSEFQENKLGELILQ